LNHLLTLQRGDSGVTSALIEKLQKAKEERERVENEVLKFTILIKFIIYLFFFFFKFQITGKFS